MSEATERLHEEMQNYKLLRKREKPIPGTRARVHKGVRPYGGRVFEVVETITEPNGRVHLDLYVNMIHGWSRDVREYRPEDVDILPPSPEKRPRR